MELQQIKNWRTFVYTMEDWLATTTESPEKITAFIDQFSPLVEHHILNYVIRQYGDIGTPLDNMHPTQAMVACTAACNKYKARFGKNVRKDHDGQDFLKAAHYGQLEGLYRGEYNDSDRMKVWNIFERWMEIK